jgi:hypothetical protein
MLTKPFFTGRQLVLALATLQLPLCAIYVIVVGAALDGKGWRVVQIQNIIK